MTLETIKVQRNTGNSYSVELFTVNEEMNIQKMGYSITKMLCTKAGSFGMDVKFKIIATE